MTQKNARGWGTHTQKILHTKNTKIHTFFSIYSLFFNLITHKKNRTKHFFCPTTTIFFHHLKKIPHPKKQQKNIPKKENRRRTLLHFLFCWQYIFLLLKNDFFSFILKLFHSRMVGQRSATWLTLLPIPRIGGSRTGLVHLLHNLFRSASRNDSFSARIFSSCTKKFSASA